MSAPLITTRDLHDGISPGRRRARAAASVVATVAAPASAATATPRGPRRPAIAPMTARLGLFVTLSGVFAPKTV